MRRAVALLAAVFLLAGTPGCGGDGAEPGAPRGATSAALKEATLVLDFIPNAVHSGIYSALARGYYRDAGVDLKVQPPGESTDAPKLLGAGRVEFAILDIHDLGIARERGLDLVGVLPIVQRPLASVIARDPDEIRTPADLAGKTAGVTGVPSDDAVLDTVLRSGGVDPSDVRRVTIGFNAVASLAAGRVDAATAFWNAEGVQLEEMGVPIREFRVDEFGAPRYPELVLATRGNKAQQASDFLDALERGYRILGNNPQSALDDLLDAVPGLDRESQEGQLEALTAAKTFSISNESGPPTALGSGNSYATWLDWAIEHGLVNKSAGTQIAAGFAYPGARLR